MASGVWWPRKIAPALRILRQQRLRIVDRQLDVLGGDAVGELDRLGQRGDDDDGAELVPALAGDLRARQQRELALDLVRDGIGERCVGGDEDRLRPAAVLGLRQEIGRDPGGIGGLVGDDQHFGRAGDHVDADGAEDLALGGGDIGVARPDDLVDRRDGLGAVGERARSPARRRSR